MFFPGRPFQPSLIFIGRALEHNTKKALHSCRIRPYSQILYQTLYQTYTRLFITNIWKKTTVESFTTLDPIDSKGSGFASRTKVRDFNFIKLPTVVV